MKVCVCVNGMKVRCVCVCEYYESAICVLCMNIMKVLMCMFVWEKRLVYDESVICRCVCVNIMKVRYVYVYEYYESVDVYVCVGKKGWCMKVRYDSTYVYVCMYVYMPIDLEG